MNPYWHMNRGGIAKHNVEHALKVAKAVFEKRIEKLFEAPANKIG